MTFIISFLIFISILATKSYFVFEGKGGDPSFLALLSIGFLILIMILGLVNFVKSKKLTHKFSFKINFLVILCITIFASSFAVNLGRDAVMWDSVALYDARARYLLGGDTFSNMVEFSKFDPTNSYYYALYPPYTSIIHYFWYLTKINLPIGIIYSLLYLVLGILVYFLTNRELGHKDALTLLLLTITNSVIFSSSVYEYTNLPYTLNLTMGIFLLYKYLNEKKLWQYLFGTGFLITSMWIRFLEPIWIGIILAFSIPLLIQKRSLKNVLLISLMIIYGIVEYLGWQSFVGGFGESTRIVNFNLTTLIEPVVGIFTGPLFSVAIFFVKSWGLIILVYLYTIYLMIRSKSNDIFLNLVILFSVLVYFSGLYFVSFQSIWWDKLGDSLIRSSAFMIPVAGFIILKHIKNGK